MAPMIAASSGPTGIRPSARTSHLAPWEREPLRFRIFSSTLDGDRENARASVGTGSGTRWTLLPPNWRGLITNEAARHSSVSTGRKLTCLPVRDGRRMSNSRN
jgi:hypothetical protein